MRSFRQVVILVQTKIQLSDMVKLSQKHSFTDYMTTASSRLSESKSQSALI